MIQIDLLALTNVQLAQLITDAAAVISNRALSQKTLFLEQKPEIVRVVNTPGKDDLHIVKTVLQKVKDGSLVRASEKDAYAQIVSKFTEWADSKKYPQSLRGSSERHFREYGHIRH